MFDISGMRLSRWMSVWSKDQNIAMALPSVYHGKAQSEIEVVMLQQFLLLTGTIGFLVITPNSIARAEGEKKFYPIALKCPQFNDGTLEFITARRMGMKVRVKADFEGNEAVIVSVAKDDNDGNGFGVRLKVDLVENDRNNQDYKEGKRFGLAAQKLFIRICLGSKSVKRKYYSTITSYIELLGLTPSEFPSKIGL